ncbi:HNH endonuclease, partial [Dyadobacter sp. CY327]|uniref:HNH endonuclease n=1 Tax=Dyadobacter sp. CY327 TaxID=2907301 RepID=UPI001F38C90C
CCPDGWGYPAVILHRDSVGVKTKVHRIMMAAFVAPSKLQVNHINGIKNDNRLENLEYVTNRENGNHCSKGKYFMKGVQRFSKNSKFVAFTTFKRKRFIIGRYDTELEAHNAYKEFVTKLGEGKYV